MKRKKEIIATISCVELWMHRKNKLNRTDSAVKSGTGYHQSNKHYNRKSKKNQQLRQEMKNSSRSCFLIALGI